MLFADTTCRPPSVLGGLNGIRVLDTAKSSNEVTFPFPRFVTGKRGWIMRFTFACPKSFLENYGFHILLPHITHEHTEQNGCDTLGLGLVNLGRGLAVFLVEEHVGLASKRNDLPT